MKIDIKYNPWFFFLLSAALFLLKVVFGFNISWFWVAFPIILSVVILLVILIWILRKK